MNNLLIIDGSALLTSHFFGAMPDELRNEKDIDKANLIAKSLLSQAHGRFTNVISGAIIEIMNTIANYKCDYCAVVFDKSTKDTFRMKLYKDYKGNRGPKLIALYDQLDLLHTLLKLIGIQAYWSGTYEADDLAGSLIEKFKGSMDNVYFWTKDHDWLQLLDKNVKGIMAYSTEDAAMDARSNFSYVPENDMFSKKSTLKAYGKQVVYDENVCLEVEGVYPKLIPDKKGLAGDKSDNIPGAPGIGPKTAVALLSAFRSIECLYDSLNATRYNTNGSDAFFAQLKPYGLKRNPYNALLDTDKDALLSKKLATIKRDIDYPGTANTLRVNYNAYTLQKICDFYELPELEDYCHRHRIIEPDEAAYDFA